MSRIERIEGIGTAVFGADGRVRLVVSDEVADLFEAAEKAGVSADEFVQSMIGQPANTNANSHPPIPDHHLSRRARRATVN